MSGETTRRTVRVDDELWDRAKEVAAERDDNLSDIIRNSLWAYVEQEGPGVGDSLIDSFTVTRIQQMRYKHGNRVDVLELLDAFEAMQRKLAEAWDDGRWVGVQDPFLIQQAIKLNAPHHANVKNPYRRQA